MLGSAGVVASLQPVPDAAVAELPLVVFPYGRHEVAPSNRVVAEAIGLQATSEAESFDLVVVGAGPAGLAAAVYGASEGLRTAVLERQAPGAPHETLLTIDATTGQNGLRQALLFREAVDVSGIALTKLDGTAKGGIALAIAQELGVPVKLIGIGEALEDLRPFDPDDFARAIIEP